MGSGPGRAGPGSSTGSGGDVAENRGQGEGLGHALGGRPGDPRRTETAGRRGHRQGAHHHRAVPVDGGGHRDQPRLELVVGDRVAAPADLAQVLLEGGAAGQGPRRCGPPAGRAAAAPRRRPAAPCPARCSAAGPGGRPSWSRRSGTCCPPGRAARRGRRGPRPGSPSRRSARRDGPRNGRATSTRPASAPPRQAYRTNTSPGRNRPSSSRRTSPPRSSATSSRDVVLLASPVAVASSVNVTESVACTTSVTSRTARSTACVPVGVATAASRVPGGCLLPMRSLSNEFQITELCSTM